MMTIKFEELNPNFSVKMQDDTEIKIGFEYYSQEPTPPKPIEIDMAMMLGTQCGYIDDYVLLEV